MCRESHWFDSEEQKFFVIIDSNPYITDVKDMLIHCFKCKEWYTCPKQNLLLKWLEQNASQKWQRAQSDNSIR